MELTRSTRDGNRFFLATTKGLASIRYLNGNWIDEGTLPDFKGEVRSIAEMPNGDLYFSTLSSGFYHVKLRKDARSIFDGANAESLSEAQGYPSVQGVTHLVPWGDRLLFKTDDGAYLYDAENNSFSEPEFLARAINNRKLESMWASNVGSPHVCLLTSGSDTSSDFGKRLSVIFENGEIKSVPYTVANFVGHIEKFYDEIGEQGPLLWVAGTYGLARIENPQLLPETRCVRSLRAGGNHEQWRGSLITEQRTPPPATILQTKFPNSFRDRLVHRSRPGAIPIQVGRRRHELDTILYRADLAIWLIERRAVPAPRHCAG